MTTLTNILFLDIETVSQQKTFEELPDTWKELWSRKADSLLRNNKEETTAEEIYERAAIYAEFGKIICISCGVIQGTGENKTFVVKSFYGHGEKEILSALCDMLNKWGQGVQKWLCAHNGKEFDFPYLCRRMIINNVPIPQLLQFAGKKPWEMNLIDTMDMWKFGEYKSFTSLHLLSQVLHVPTSKDDIDGSMVGKVYWQENDLNRIVHYCQKDVVTMAQIYLRLTNESLISERNIEFK